MGLPFFSSFPIPSSPSSPREASGQQIDGNRGCTAAVARELGPEGKPRTTIRRGTPTLGHATGLDKEPYASALVAAPYPNLPRSMAAAWSGKGVVGGGGALRAIRGEPSDDATSWRRAAMSLSPFPHKYTIRDEPSDDAAEWERGTTSWRRVAQL